MAIQVPGFRPGIFKAGADLSAKQFHSVSQDASGDLVTTGAGELSMGALNNKPPLGAGCELEMDGISKGTSGAAFSINDKLMSNAAGKYITATSGNHVAAIALSAAGGADELATIKIVGSSGQVLA